MHLTAQSRSKIKFDELVSLYDQVSQFIVANTDFLGAQNRLWSREQLPVSTQQKQSGFQLARPIQHK